MTRRTVLKIGFGALTPAAKCAKFNLFGASPERAALSRRETHKRPDVALLAPGGKVRGVEALAASHRCDLACSRQGVGLTHDTQLVLGTEAPVARALGQLGVGHPLRQRTHRLPSLAYGSLRESVGDLRHRVQGR